MMKLLSALTLFAIVTPVTASVPSPGKWVKVPVFAADLPGLIGVTRPTNISGDGQGPIVGYEVYTRNSVSGSLYNVATSVTTGLSGGFPIAAAPSSMGLRLSPDGATAYLVSSSTFGWGVFSESVATEQPTVLKEFPLLPTAVPPAIELNADGTCLTEFSQSVPGMLRAMRLRDASIQNFAETPFHRPTQAPILGVSTATQCQAVAFVSPATDLIPGNFSELPQVFQRSWDSSQLSIAAFAEGGEFPYEGAEAAMVSLDGRHLAFQSASGDITPVAGQGDQTHRIFVIDRAAGIPTLVLPSTPAMKSMEILDLSPSGNSILARSCDDAYGDGICTLFAATRGTQGWSSVQIPAPASGLSFESARIAADGRSLSVVFDNGQSPGNARDGLAVYAYLLATPLP